MAKLFMCDAAMHGFASLEQVAEVETLCGTPYYPPRNQACADYLNSLYMLWRNLDPYNVYKWCGMSGPDPQGGCLTDTMALMNLAPATHGVTSLICVLACFAEMCCGGRRTTTGPAMGSTDGADIHSVQRSAPAGSSSCFHQFRCRSHVSVVRRLST